MSAAMLDSLDPGTRRALILLGGVLLGHVIGMVAIVWMDR